jgi:hypothetical protein
LGVCRYRHCVARPENLIRERTSPRGWGFREAPRPDIIHNATVNVRDRVKDFSQQVADGHIGTLVDDTACVVDRNVHLP